MTAGLVGCLLHLAYVAVLAHKHGKPHQPLSITFDAGAGPFIAFHVHALLSAAATQS